MQSAELAALAKEVRNECAMVSLLDFAEVAE